MTQPTTLTDAIRSILDRAGHGDRSAVLTLAAAISSADDQGRTTVNAIAIGYRVAYLEAMRNDGRDADGEAGRLSLDEIRAQLATSDLPRLVATRILEVEGDPRDATASVRVAAEVWATTTGLRRSVVMQVLRSTGEQPTIPAPSASTAGSSRLEARGLVKVYKRRKVVNDVAITVRQGEIVGLLGPNGAGKTTSFYMITGLIAPDEGHILLDGEDITEMPMYQRARRGVGYLSQEPSIFRKLTVEENILAILETLPISSKEREAKLERLLDELSIKHLRKSRAYALSGGERRRLEITRALVTEPKFMMLDEPFAGVDPIAVHDIQQIVAGLRHRGIGVVISDHNVEQTLDIVDRAYIMFDGQVKVSGTVQELVFDDTVADIYLGPTLTARLRQRFAERQERKISNEIVVDATTSWPSSPTPDEGSATE
jgi:lipopolysaccharide export system ATP-binding protein